MVSNPNEIVYCRMYTEMGMYAYYNIKDITIRIAEAIGKWIASHRGQWVNGISIWDGIVFNLVEGRCCININALTHIHIHSRNPRAIYQPGHDNKRSGLKAEYRNMDETYLFMTLIHKLCLSLTYQGHLCVNIYNACLIILLINYSFIPLWQILVDKFNGFTSFVI